MKKYTISPIGIVHSPYQTREQAPRQAAYSKGAKGIIEVYEKYLPGLEGLENYEHIIVLFYFNQNLGYNLTALPPGKDKPRGVFATRSPRRPNFVGMSVVKLEKIEGNHLYITSLDMLDGTPVIDIKPYVADLDSKPGLKK